MSSFTKTKFTFLTFLFIYLIALNPCRAQQAGSLDTSFRLGRNYGSLYPIRKFWALNDGSLLCFNESSNYFSGVKTGSFFKILPNGNLDASYQSLSISFHPITGFCSSDYYRNVFKVLGDGTVYLYSNNQVVGDSISAGSQLLKFSPNGQLLLQGNMPPGIDNQYIASDEGFQPFLSNSDLVFTSGDSVVFLNLNLEKDTTYPTIRINSSQRWLHKMLVQNPTSNYLVFVNQNWNALKYVSLNLGTKTVGDTFSSPHINGKRPEPIEIDKWGRIYELYQKLDTLNQVVYDRIIRRLPNGQIDSGYLCRVKPFYLTQFPFLGKFA